MIQTAATMRYRVRVNTDCGPQELELDATDETQLRQAVARMVFFTG